MVFKKKFYKKAYKKGAKRTAFKAKIRSGPSMMVHSYKRKVELAKTQLSTITATGSPYLLAFPFFFQTLPDSTVFQSLYSQYRINAIKFEMVLGTNCAFDGIISGLTFHTAVNYINSDVFPATLDEIQEFATYKKYVPGSNDRTLKRYFKPRTSTPALTAGAGVGYVSTKAGWCDMGTTGQAIVHHGLWVGISYDGPPATTGTIQTYVTYYFQCKNPR